MCITPSCLKTKIVSNQDWMPPNCVDSSVHWTSYWADQTSGVACTNLLQNTVGLRCENTMRELDKYRNTVLVRNGLNYVRFFFGQNWYGFSLASQWVLVWCWLSEVYMNFMCLVVSAETAVSVSSLAKYARLAWSACHLCGFAVRLFIGVKHIYIFIIITFPSHTAEGAKIRLREFRQSVWCLCPNQDLTAFPYRCCSSASVAVAHLPNWPPNSSSYLFIAFFVFSFPLQI